MVQAMSANLSELRPVEQLFLDIPIHDILNNNAELQVVEPWATLYIDAIRGERFGNAVWARYHIIGDVEDGTQIRLCLM